MKRAPGCTWPEAGDTDAAQPETWRGQLLLAMSAVEAAAAAGQQKLTPSRLLAAVESLQLLLETIVMGLLEETFKQQWG